MTKDYIVKAFLGTHVVPQGLFELSEYFRLYDPIEFSYEKEDGVIVAVSKNFRYGSIITSGTTPEELDANIKDAILSSFSVPAAYAKEAQVKRTDETRQQYALA